MHLYAYICIYICIYMFVTYLYNEHISNYDVFDVYTLHSHAHMCRYIYILLWPMKTKVDHGELKSLKLRCKYVCVCDTYTYAYIYMHMCVRDICLSISIYIYIYLLIINLLSIYICMYHGHWNIHQEPWVSPYFTMKEGSIMSMIIIT